MDIVTECRNSNLEIRDSFNKALSLKEKDPSEATDSMVVLGNIFSAGIDEQKKESLELFMRAGNAGNTLVCSFQKLSG